LKTVKDRLNSTGLVKLNQWTLTKPAGKAHNRRVEISLIKEFLKYLWKTP
jgi:uncharacterized Rmd1/YagE family protein